MRPPYLATRGMLSYVGLFSEVGVSTVSVYVSDSSTPQSVVTAYLTVTSSSVPSIADVLSSPHSVPLSWYQVTLALRA